jgi:hypothetical protein
MFRPSIDALFKVSVARLAPRSTALPMSEDVGEPVEAGQPDLFGGTVQPNSTDP